MEVFLSLDTQRSNRMSFERVEPRSLTFTKNTKYRRYHALTPKAKKLIIALSELEENSIVDRKQLIKHMNAPPRIINEMLERLHKSRMIVLKSTKIHVFGITMEFARGQYVFVKKILPAQDFATQDWVVSGPKSHFAGLRIFKLVDENPRRKGTCGWHSFNLYVDGMSFEDYRRKGGRNNDLKWDVDHGFVQLKL